MQQIYYEKWDKMERTIFMDYFTTVSTSDYAASSGGMINE
jgi:hypothetical protein